MEPLKLTAVQLPETDEASLTSFAVSNERSIHRILSDLHERADLITLFSVSDLDTFVLTKIVAVGKKGVVFELNTDQARIERLQYDSACLAVCLLEGLKIQFSVNVEQVDRHGESITLRCVMPTTIFRIQRREGFRVTPSAGYGATAVIRYGNRSEERFELIDISVTGTSFVVQHSEHFVVGAQFEHSLLYLGQYSPLPCTLQVSTVVEHLVDGMDGDYFKIGCAFRHLSGEVERELQRFVTDMERAGRLLPPL